MLIGNMETQKAVAEQDELMRGYNASSKVRRVTKQDIQLLRNADKLRKYEIDKLLWILSLFLRGKKFPSGELDEDQYFAHILNIVEFVVDEQTLAILLDFDAEAFFQVILLLFSGKPW